MEPAEVWFPDGDVDRSSASSPRPSPPTIVGGEGDGSEVPRRRWVSTFDGVPSLQDR